MSGQTLWLLFVGSPSLLINQRYASEHKPAGDIAPGDAYPQTLVNPIKQEAYHEGSIYRDRRT